MCLGFLGFLREIITMTNGLKSTNIGKLGHIHRKQQTEQRLGDCTKEVSALVYVQTVCAKGRQKLYPLCHIRNLNWMHKNIALIVQNSYEPNTSHPWLGSLYEGENRTDQ